MATNFVGFIHRTGCRWTQAASGAAGWASIGLASSLDWPFPMLKYKYVSQIKYTENFYQTALGNWYGLKLPKY